MKKILITGSYGFIGKNLLLRIPKKYLVYEFNRNNPIDDLKKLIISGEIDLIYHLAGENRPKNPAEFYYSNVFLTQEIADAIKKSNKIIPIIYSSSVQALLDNSYGNSKKKAEDVLGDLYQRNKSGVLVYRLPGIFGKGCKPNYNSVVATFCHNYINNINVEIDDKERLLELAYIDDVIDELLVWIEQKLNGFKIVNLKNIYKIKLGELAEKISNFHNNRSNLIIDKVAFGIDRALYSTYISNLSAENVSYSVLAHEDLRGKFFELFKSTIFGQISVFTIKPGVIRGGHYHHTKTEKFFVVKGEVKISHKSLFDNNCFYVVVSDKSPCIVDTIPGYAHQIQNIGSDEAFIIVWANEIFDEDKPDTFAYKGLYD